jgi:uncharacterized protein YxjI
MFCPNCGVEISENQKFCQTCGVEINSRENISADEPNQELNTKETSENLGLFDLDRNYYVLKEKYWDFGSGEILDENGNEIGHMRRIFISLRRKIELLETDGSIGATIHEKIISARGAQDLKDPQGNMIARIKKKITSFFRPKFWLEDPEGNRWYEAQGEFLGWSFKIYDLTTDKVVAEIEKADRWRDIFLRGLFDFKDTYALKILDNKTDRRILVGFVLSIDNVLHDNRMGPMGVPIWGPFPRRRPGRFPGRFPGGWGRGPGRRCC